MTSKYEIVKEKRRLLVQRKDRKPIHSGILGYYFDDLVSAERHIIRLESGKWFKDNNIEEAKE